MKSKVSNYNSFQIIFGNSNCHPRMVIDKLIQFIQSKIASVYVYNAYVHTCERKKSLTKKRSKKSQ